MDRGSASRLASYFGLVDADSTPDPRKQSPTASMPLRISAGLMAVLVLAVLLDLADLFGAGPASWVIRAAVAWTLVVSFSFVADRIATREFRARRRWRDPPSTL